MNFSLKFIHEVHKDDKNNRNYSNKIAQRNILQWFALVQVASTKAPCSVHGFCT